MSKQVQGKHCSDLGHGFRIVIYARKMEVIYAMAEQIVCDYPDWTNRHLREENGGLSCGRYREDESSSPGNAVEGGGIGEDLPKKRARRRTAWDEERERENEVRGREWRERKRMERERIKRTRWQPGGGGKNKKWYLSGDAGAGTWATEKGRASIWWLP